jgi:hypothetical protein
VRLDEMREPSPAPAWVPNQRDLVEARELS